MHLHLTRPFILTFWLATSLVWMNASLARAETYNVNLAADLPDIAPGDGICGTDESNTFCSLRAAIQEANARAAMEGSTLEPNLIVLWYGTYRLTIEGPDEDAAATGDLDINSRIEIRGAGANFTHIDANGLDRVLDIAPAPFGPASDVVASISDLTISGGEVTGIGGGVRVSSSLTLDHVVVRDNTSLPSLSFGDSAGGGLGMTRYSQPGIELLVFDSQIEHNYADIGGGISAMESGSLTVTRSIIAANEADNGGGIASFLAEQPPVITDTTIADNFGRSGGGGLWGMGTLVRSAVLRNLTHGAGGGVRSVQGDVSLTNCTISGNVSFGGGAGIANGSSVELLNVTVADNVSYGEGFAGAGGIFHFFGEDMMTGTYATNTIVARNVPFDCGGEVVYSGGSNIDSDGSCDWGTDTDLSNVDPLLGVLDYHGGHTQSYELLPGSPAIDAAATLDYVTDDQRGVARPQDGDGDGNATSDIGAFEYKPEPLFLFWLWLMSLFGGG